MTRECHVRNCESVRVEFPCATRLIIPNKIFRIFNEFWYLYSTINGMMKLIALIFSYIVLCLRLLSPGGVRGVTAENIALRQQLITLSRSQKRASRLTFFEKITFGLLASMISVKRLAKIAIILKPATLLKFHKALVNRKYRLLFSNKSSKKPGPKGPDEKVVPLIIEMKKRNPSYGHKRCHHGIDGIIPLDKADELSNTVVSIDKYRWKKHCNGLFELPIAAYIQNKAREILSN